jgi:hypothetical protein
MPYAALQLASDLTQQKAKNPSANIDFPVTSRLKSLFCRSTHTMTSLRVGLRPPNHS